jgi:hypothetical protein
MNVFCYLLTSVSVTLNVWISFKCFHFNQDKVSTNYIMCMIAFNVCFVHWSLHSALHFTLFPLLHSALIGYMKLHWGTVNCHYSFIQHNIPTPTLDYNANKPISRNPCEYKLVLVHHILNLEDLECYIQDVSKLSYQAFG